MILLRYLTREILTSMFAVSFALLLIVISSRLVKFLAMAASGNVAGDVLVWMVVYRLPSFLELILPLGMFIGILLAYGRLYVESEMAVMSACGVSNRKLAFYTLFSALIVSLLVGFLSLYLTPSSLQKARDITNDKRNSEGVNTLVPGKFKLYGDGGRVSYTRDISEDHSLMTDVFIATRIPEKNREGQVQLVVANRGGVRVDRDNDVRYLELKQGAQYKITPGKHDLELTRFGTMGQFLDERDASLSEHADIDGTTTAVLMTREDNEAKAALQWRMSLPVMVLVMSIIALAMSRTNHRKGRYTKMLPAILIYLLYLILMSAMRSAIETGKLPVDIGLWPLHVAFFLLALLLFNSERMIFTIKRWRSS